MERIRTLINKLQKQLDQKAEATVMLGTVKVLQLELSALSASDKQQTSSKVSVVMPSSSGFPIQAPISETIKTTAKEPVAVQQEPVYPQPKYEQPVHQQTSVAAKRQDNSNWLFDPVEEIPTLAHQ